jgi:hypothetical protein
MRETEQKNPTQRKPISPKLRFEVFKRDNFTCQYCGKKAPDVILNVDHIHPVKHGGDNKIVNLITSCLECNQGKGKRKLSDDSELSKQHKQLELLNERRKQLEMMMKWRVELMKSQNDEVDILANYLNQKFNCGFFLNELGKSKLKEYLKRATFARLLELVDETYESMSSSIIKFGANQKTFEIGWSILRAKFLVEYSTIPERKKYLRGILYNRFARDPYFEECIGVVDNYYERYTDIDSHKRLIGIAKSVIDCSDFFCQSTKLFT